MPDEALARLKELLHASISETPEVLGRHVARTRSLILEVADETEEERIDLDRIQSDFSYAVLSILEEEADKDLLPGCVEALLDMGGTGNALALKLMRKRRVPPLEMEAMTRDCPISRRIRHLNRYFLLGREFESGVTTALFQDLRKLQEEQPDEFLAFLLESVEREAPVSYPLQKILLESAFWVWVKRLLKLPMEDGQLIQVARALKGLESPEVAEELARLLDRESEDVLLALLDTIEAVGMVGDPGLLAAVKPLFKHGSETVRLRALEVLGALGDPKYPLIFLKFRRAHPQLGQRLACAALRLEGAGFQAALAAAKPAERPDLIRFMLFVLSRLDGAGFAAVIPETPGLKADPEAVKALVRTVKGLGKGASLEKALAIQGGTAQGGEPRKGRAGGGGEASLAESLKSSDSVADADFSGRTVSGGRFAGKRLRSVSLENAVINRTAFSECAFSNVDFSGAKLEDVTFTGCTFRHVRFSDASIKDSAFESCSVDICEFDRTAMHAVGMADLSVSLCSFAESSLTSMDMRGCAFEACSFRDALLDGLHAVSLGLENGDLSRCVLRRAHIRGLGVSECFFTGARIHDVDLGNIQAQGCRFGGVLAGGVRGVAPEFLRLAQATLEGLARKPLSGSKAGALPDEPRNGKDAALAAKAVAEWFFRRETASALSAAEFNNRRRLRWALHKLGPGPAMFIRVLPMILAADVFEISEGRVEPTPVEMVGHFPSNGELRIMASHFKEFPRGEAGPETISIQGLYTIGSTGTIAQTQSSDLDFWVCYDQAEASERALDLFRDKLAWLEQWAEAKYGLEVHFFPMDLEKARNNDFGFSDEEGAGSSQALLLKEEFYRTALRVAGKVPVWHLTPAGCDEKRYRALARRYLAGQGVSADAVVDLGFLGRIPPEEFFGASLWQIVKALKSPFKSVMKFALLDTYTSGRGGTGTADLVCDRLKDNLHQGRDGFWECDPYALLFKRIVDHYQARKNAGALELMRMAFLLKTGVGERDLPPGAPVPRAGNRYAEYYFPAFSLAITGRTMAGERLAHFEDWSRIGQMVGRYMFKTYERIGKRPDFHDGVAITDQDVARLGRRIFSFFGQVDNKIMRVPFMTSPRGMFRGLHLYAEKTAGVTTAWLARGESGGKGGGRSRTEDIRRDESPIRLLAWLVANSIYSPEMFIQYDPDLAPVSAADIENLLKGLHELFPIKRTFYTDLEETLVPERVCRIFVAANFLAHRAETRIVQASVVYSTNWGQMFMIPEAVNLKALANAGLNFLRENIRLDIAPEVVVRGFTPEHSKCPKLSFKML